MRRFLFSTVVFIAFAPLCLAQEGVPPVPLPLPPAESTAPEETARLEIKPDSFISALAAAYQNNPRLKAEREALKALDEQVSEAMSGWRPSLGAQYDKGRQRTRIGTQDWGYENTRTRALSFDQPIYSGGEISARIKATRARMKAGRARLLSTEQAVLLDAVRAYVDIAQAADRLELSRKNVEVLGKHRDVTQSRFDAGDLTRTDVTQAQARLARAEAEIRRAEGDLAAARATFQRSIGFPPEIYALPEIMPKLPASLEEARERALAQSPVLKEAQFSEKAADSDIGIRTANILPDVSLRGAMNRTDGSSIPGIGGFDQDSLTVNVSVPLYQSGGEYARLRAAKKRYQQARFDSADAQDEVVESVTRAWADYQAALAVITSGKAAVDAAQSALEGVKEEYDNGERTTLDVLDAEQELFSNQIDLLQARRNKIVLAYGLAAASGELTAKELALPVEIYDPIAHYDAVKWLPIGF